MRLKHLKLASIIWSLLFLFSCLTINIYFPEAAVKKTADEIIGRIIRFLLTVIVFFNTFLSVGIIKKEIATEIITQV